MAGKSASLLTKTQRRRLRNDFESVDRDAKQRDQQLIRERVRSGILDFQQLADYPDSQYKLAFADVPEEELRAALVDTYLAAERIRDLHRYDRAQLLTEAQTRAEDVSVEASDVRSLDRLDLHTAEAVRRQTKDRLGMSRWEKHTMRLVKLTSGVGIVGIILFLILILGGSGAGGSEVEIPRTFAFFFSYPLYMAGLLSVVVVAVLTLRQDIIPALVTLANKSRKVGRTVWRRWGLERGWHRRNDDRTAWWKWGESQEDASESSTDDKGEPALDRLRRRYAAGKLTDEQFEQKLERLLDTETLEDAADHVNARE